MSPIFAPKSGIRLVPVDLGEQRVRVPVAEIAGKRPGKTLLVTGGMDGDEYAGIEAAYRLVSAFAKGEFAGRLIIVPVVNVPGFFGECSQNPLDGRFPKYVFPGKAKGKPTERLIHWLVSTHVERADAWHDMHAGAITEGMNPFLWLYKTGVPAADALAEQLIAADEAEAVVYESAGRMSKAGQLARAGRVYALAESGGRGSFSDADVERHLVWVRAMMGVLDMIDAPPVVSRSSRVLTRVHYSSASFEGIWRPVTPFPKEVRRGDLLGTCARLDASGSRDVRAGADGRVLWWKETMRMQRSDVLCAIGSA